MEEIKIPQKKILAIVVFLLIVTIFLLSLFLGYLENNSIFTETCPQAPQANYDFCNPKPSCSNVQYASLKEFNTFDLWLANSPNPTPLIVFFHGGSFQRGDKNDILIHCKQELNYSYIRFFLENGISVATVNYRLLGQEYPQWKYTLEWYENTSKYPAPMIDSAKAIVFLREHATEYNIDPEQIAITGTSAGGVLSMWLGWHEPLPEENISTKPNCIAPWKGLSTADPRIVRQILPDLYYSNIYNPGFGFFGLTRPENMTPEQEDVFYEPYDSLFKEASPATHISSEDPPSFLYYTEPIILPKTGKKSGLHNPEFGIYATKILEEKGIPFELYYPPNNFLPENQIVEKMLNFFNENDCFK